METSPSLLEQLKEPSNGAAWNRFVGLYSPLLINWARRAGVPADDSADLVQDVLLTLVQKLPEFRYDSNQSFRGWLRTVTLNRWRDLCRRRRLLQVELDPLDVADPGGSLRFWGAEYEQQLVAQALRLMQARFQEPTWRAFWGVTVEGRPAAEVAQELGVSPGAIYISKCRVLKHLRTELAGLLD